MPDDKRCPQCGLVKATSGFFSNAARGDGLSGYCRECHLVASKASLLRLRLRVLDLIGGRRCVRCDIKDVRVLVIDHLAGGGRAHRDDARSSYSLYRYVESHPDEFQVLCFNCNHLKRLEEGESGKAYAFVVAAKGPPAKVTKPRRWARDFDACVGCGTTNTRHHSRGLCITCTQAAVRRARGAAVRAARTIKAAEGRPWSRNFASCVNCGTTTVPHGGHGLCANCYMSAYYAKRQLVSRLG